MLFVPRDCLHLEYASRVIPTHPLILLPPASPTPNATRPPILPTYLVSSVKIDSSRQHQIRPKIDMATQPTTTHDEKEEAQSKPEAEPSPSRHMSALSEKDAEAGISTPQVSSASTTDVEAELELDQPLAPEHAHHDGIPNGGLQAWLQVVGSFFLFMNSWYVTCIYISSR